MNKEEGKCVCDMEFEDRDWEHPKCDVAVHHYAFGDILYIYDKKKGTSGTMVEIEGCPYLHAMIDHETGEFLGVSIMNFESIVKDVLKRDEEIESEQEE